MAQSKIKQNEVENKSILGLLQNWKLFLLAGFLILVTIFFSFSLFTNKTENKNAQAATVYSCPSDFTGPDANNKCSINPIKECPSINSGALNANGDSLTLDPNNFINSSGILYPVVDCVISIYTSTGLNGLCGIGGKVSGCVSFTCPATATGLGFGTSSTVNLSGTRDVLGYAYSFIPRDVIGYRECHYEKVDQCNTSRLPTTYDTVTKKCLMAATATTVIDTCPPGQYLNVSCVPCPVNTYKTTTTTTQADCMPCPANTSTSSATGSSSLAQCVATIVEPLLITPDKITFTPTKKNGAVYASDDLIIKVASDSRFTQSGKTSVCKLKVKYYGYSDSETGGYGITQSKINQVVQGSFNQSSGSFESDYSDSAGCSFKLTKEVQNQPRWEFEIRVVRSDGQIFGTQESYFMLYGAVGIVGISSN